MITIQQVHVRAASAVLFVMAGFTSTGFGVELNSTPSVEIVGRTVTAMMSPSAPAIHPNSRPHVVVIEVSPSATANGFNSVSGAEQWQRSLGNDKSMSLSVVRSSIKLDAGFPPQGDAYQPPREAHHALWRWLAVQSVDLLIVAEQSPELSKPTWSYAASSAIELKRQSPKLLEALKPVETNVPRSPSASLWDETGRSKVAGVGTIPALRVQVPVGQVVDWQQLHSSLSQISLSACRRELNLRAKRSPMKVVEQLSRHYGDKPQLHYIPALAAICRLRHEAAVSPNDRVLFDRFSNQWPNAPLPAKNGSEIAGRLLLCELARESKQRESFVEYIRQTADQAFDEQGHPREAMPFHAEMSDAVFMSPPLLAEAGRLTKEDKYFDACLRHVKFIQELCLRPDGLYRHHPSNEAAWGRGNGFPALGLAWAVSAIPQQHPASSDLKSSLLSHLRILKTHQGRDGMWRQIIDRKDSYREMTSSCMILFAMKRATDRGWAKDGEFSDSIDRAWRAINLRIGADGALINVCTGTGKQPKFDDYYLRKAILGTDPRGGAMALMAAVEMAGKQIP